ncbi:TIGR01777 family oxidoreductase [Chryseobacterium camelliae]|uniref:TIGR01777 family oxidoreductase n=1 Tax=Chryseobacterium camelliae TaxID=1265445 RepID=UPI001E4293E3|nr:TIGR01777 family oxidoreductase [Chryseobacterium camelliae]
MNTIQHIMKIIIAGGTGFLGDRLKKFFTSRGHRVFILTRQPGQEHEIYWDARTLGDWKDYLEGADVLINLTGKSVDCRYTEKNRQEIYTSRIDSTRVLQQAVDQCAHPPKIWLNASSATIYDHSEQHLNTEANGIIGDDFSMNICKSWEAEFFRAENSEIRKVALRTSIVMGNSGGAFPKLKAVTKLFLGGRQGSGRQKVSWIHIGDFCRALEWIIDHAEISGVINVTAPQPLTNAEMMNKLRKRMKMPFGLNAAVWQLKIASFFLRTETELLLKSRNVYPEKLLHSGFSFAYPDMEAALKDLIK